MPVLYTSSRRRPPRIRANGVYGYDFTYQHAPYYFPQMPNAYDLPTKYFHPLAYHTSDIQFLVPELARRESGCEFGPKHRPTT